MSYVGDFTPQETTDTEAEPDTFTYFGATFEIPAKIGAGSLLMFTWQIKEADSMSKRGEAARRKATSVERLAAARQMEVEAELSASAAVMALLRAVFGEHQIGRLLATVDDNGVQPAGLMELCDQIQEVIADRPTKRSAVSSAGPSISGVTSPDSGYSEVVIVPETVPQEPVAASAPARPRPPRRPTAPTAQTFTPAPETPLVMTPRDLQMAMIEGASTPVG